MISVTNYANLFDCLLHPPRAALGEDGIQVAFKQGAGVLEVLFGVGFGGGDAVKRFVQNANDSLLFGERRESEIKCTNLVSHQAVNGGTTTNHREKHVHFRLEKPVK